MGLEMRGLRAASYEDLFTETVSRNVCGLDVFDMACSLVPVRRAAYQAASAGSLWKWELAAWLLSQTGSRCTSAVRACLAVTVACQWASIEVDNFAAGKKQPEHEQLPPHHTWSPLKIAWSVIRALVLNAT